MPLHRETHNLGNSPCIFVALRGVRKAAMCPKILLFLVPIFITSFQLQATAEPINNITVVGGVFCDACSENTFSNHSYFLQGVQVLLQCKFRANSRSREETLITATKTTDRFGVYRLDIPPTEGFDCKQGREIRSFCRASLIRPSSSLCNVMGLRSSATHVAIKPRESNICIVNLNAMNYRPTKRDVGVCGAQKRGQSSSLDSSLCFFWPLFPPFGLPWLHWPPLPFAFPPLPFPFNSIPLPDPSSLPFSLPPWLGFLNPPSLPTAPPPPSPS